jgi:protein-tyrosine phosphatase
MAEGLLITELTKRGWQNRVRVDSAGTHAGEFARAADPRAQKILQRDGVDIRKLRSRQVRSEDFEDFDYILAMDRANYQWLLKASGGAAIEQISLINSWSKTSLPPEVPDPYFGNLAGFELVSSMLRQSVSGFLEELQPGSSS